MSVVLHPRVPLALRDGWAVRAELTTDAGSYAPAPLPGATRIDVGEPMPAGADAVAPLEVVVTRGDRTEIIAPVAAGEGVLPAGADADRGKTLAREGRRLTPIQAAVLAAAGVGRVHIREPRVRLVRVRAAGDDVIDAAMDLLAGEIAAAGGRILGDERGTSDARLDDALQDDAADAIIAIGGTGSGRTTRACTRWRASAASRRTASRSRPARPRPSASLGRGPSCSCRAGSMRRWRSGSCSAGGCWRGLPAAPTRKPATKARLARKVASAVGLAEVVPVRCATARRSP